MIIGIASQNDAINIYKRNNNKHHYLKYKYARFVSSKKDCIQMDFVIIIIVKVVGLYISKQSFNKIEYFLIV